LKPVKPVMNMSGFCAWRLILKYAATAFKFQNVASDFNLRPYTVVQRLGDGFKFDFLKKGRGDIENKHSTGVDDPPFSPRVCVMAFTLKLSHLRSQNECTFSMTLLPGQLQKHVSLNQQVRNSSN